MRSMVEGASDSKLRCRCRNFVESRAPPTAEERGPPSPLSWGGMESEGEAFAHWQAKLSRSADARRVAGGAVRRAHPVGMARAMRPRGIVPLLREEAMPPGANLLRRRPAGVPAKALEPGEGEAQDAAQGMGPARQPQLSVMKRADAFAAMSPALEINRGEDRRSGVAPRGQFWQGPRRFAPDAAALYAGHLPCGPALKNLPSK